jgi:type II secretion system protein N
MTDKKLLIRRLSFAAYFAVIFFIFLLLLFPFDRVKSKLESEIGKNTPFELSVARISPRFFNHFVLTDVVVSDKKGKVLLESPSVHTAISLFGLIRDRISVDVSARAYGGELSVIAQQGPRTRYVRLDANDLDIGSYPLLKDLGLKLSGKLGGTMEMTGDSGKGRLWLKGLTSRDLKIKGFQIPDLDFDECWMEADVKRDRLTIKKLEMNGKDLKVRCMGDVVLSEHGTLNLTVRIKPSERLAHEQAGILAFLKNKDAEGFYQFSLGGTVSQPLPRL